jgi:hypothetical protein
MALEAIIFTAAEYAAEYAAELAAEQATVLLGEAGSEFAAETFGTMAALIKGRQQLDQLNRVIRFISEPQVQVQHQEQQHHEITSMPNTYHPTRSPIENVIKSAMRFQIKHTPGKKTLRAGAKRVVVAAMHVGVIPT